MQRPFFCFILGYKSLFFANKQDVFLKNTIFAKE